MSESHYRLKLTPIHSTRDVIRLFISVNESGLETIRLSVKETELFKVKVIKQIFITASTPKKERALTKMSKFFSWEAELKAVTDNTDIITSTSDDGTITAPLYLGAQKIGRGGFFRFKGKSSVLVYDGKLTQGRWHYHYFDDANKTNSTSNGNRLIEYNFTF